MRVIIDTNVLISAILKDRDPEVIILFVVSRDDFEWVASSAILKEYKEVLSRKKFGLPATLIKQWLDLLERLAVLIDIDISVDFPRDQKDAKFLECALVVDADFLITGDRDFSQAQRIVNTRIVSVSMFKRLVCDPLS